MTFRTNWWVEISGYLWLQLQSVETFTSGDRRLHPAGQPIPSAQSARRFTHGDREPYSALSTWSQVFCICPDRFQAALWPDSGLEVPCLVPLQIFLSFPISYEASDLKKWRRIIIIYNYFTGKLWEINFTKGFHNQFCLESIHDVARDVLYAKFVGWTRG